MAMAAHLDSRPASGNPDLDLIWLVMECEGSLSIHHRYSEERGVYDSTLFFAPSRINIRSGDHRLFGFGHLREEEEEAEVSRPGPKSLSGESGSD